jgi:anti-sigma factor RsiW
MDCIDARTHLVGLLRGRLARTEQDALHSHLSGCELAAALTVGVVGVLAWRVSSDREARAAVVAEAVSDHLRVLADPRGLELVSSESHQVKPWFEGRIDFAPEVPLPEVPELRLRGGGVGYFLDRKAAVVAYTLRRHAVTLLAFRPDGLPLLEAGSPLTTTALRGFRVATWRGSGVGYALVSDVAPEEFEALAAAFASRTSR